MPLIRRKIPGTNKVVLVRYPKSLLPRLKTNPASDRENNSKASVELADEDDRKWLEDEVLDRSFRGFISSLTPANKKRGQTPLPV